MEAPESAKTITVFVNGDSNYNGKERFQIDWNNWKNGYNLAYKSVFYELLKSQVLLNLNKKFVVNRKRTPTFDTLLGDVTSGVKAPFGAVRNLYTPVGGTRISSKFTFSSYKIFIDRIYSQLLYSGIIFLFNQSGHGVDKRPPLFSK